MRNAFKFYCACIQWNREHGHVVPEKSTRWHVERVGKKEFERLFELGRKRFI